MRQMFVCLVVLVAMAGCKREAQEAQQAEPTAGEEVPAMAASPGPPAMAVIDPEDVELEIWAIDVGQGDATLIVGPPSISGERFSMLVDAGRGTSTRAIEPALADAGVTELNVFVATHYDEDHVGGAVEASGQSVLWTTNEADGALECESRSFFPTVAIVDPGPSPRITDTEKEWDDCVAQLTGGTDEPEHVQVMNGNNLGKVFPLGGNYTAKIVAGGGHVLGTTGQILNANSKNEMSVAVLVSNTAGFDFLVTGDLIGQPSNPNEPSALENAALEGKLGEKLEADGVVVEILQVGHHGAANASENDFIAAIRPMIAIISVGAKNNHGHPHNRTLETIENNNVPIILQTSAGKRRDADPAPHEFEGCEDNDPDCVETMQISVNGTFHIAVDGDKYDIRSLESSSYYFTQEGVLTTMVLLECGATGCEITEE